MLSAENAAVLMTSSGTMSWQQEKKLEDAKYSEDGSRIESNWNQQPIVFRKKGDPMMGKVKRPSPFVFNPRDNYTTEP